MAVTLSDSERQRCERWTRVMGYHRPVGCFNPGKQSEHKERRFFTEELALRAGLIGDGEAELGNSRRG